MSKQLRVQVEQADAATVAFEVDEHATAPLLQSMEQAGIEAHYHCRAGFCGACRTRLVSGSVEYTTEPLAYIRNGDILPCVCIALSDLELDH